MGYLGTSKSQSRIYLMGHTKKIEDLFRMKEGKVHMKQYIIIHVLTIFLCKENIKTGASIVKILRLTSNYERELKETKFRYIFIRDFYNSNQIANRCGQKKKKKKKKIFGKKKKKKKKKKK